MSDPAVLEPIAITGATGFIGKHLVRALVSAGSRPALLTHCGTAEDRFAARSELTKHEVDLANRASIREALNERKPATVFHLAGTRGRGDARGAAAACDELNLNATVWLLEAAMGAGVRRVVIVGTAEEYGDQPGPLNESLSTRAASPYGISKARATNRALELHEREGCPVVVVRPFSVYGPGQPHHMFVAEAVDSAVRNVEFKMSRGEQKRDLIFVEDVVRGLIAAASAPDVEGRVINLGSGQCHRLREVAELIWTLTGATASLLIGARDAAEAELYDTWADIRNARRLLGWQPRVELEDGLRRTIESAKDQLAARAQVCQVM